MISEEDKKQILRISKKYKVKKVMLFGSSLQDCDIAKDIDLAVEGAPRGDFFKYYSELLFGLSKPVDIVELKENDRFSAFISRKGVILYG